MSLQSDKIDSDSSVLLDSSPLLHEDKDKAAGAAAELRALVALTIPITATFVLEIVPSLVSVLLVGHLGKDYLDASSLANMFSNVTGLSVCLGMATGLDTLVSQAHGAQESKKVGIYLQRALLVQLIVFVPIVLVNFFTADILKLAQQPADVSDLAGRFARYMLPGLPCVALYELLKKTMQAQNSTLPTLLIAVLGNGVNVGVGYWLVHVRDDVGFIGAAIGKSVGQFTLGFALLAYLWLTGEFKSFWPGWSKQAFQGLRQYLSLAIPGLLQMCLEWWAFEFIALFAGLLPDPRTALAAHTIVFNVTGVSFMSFLGSSVAVSIRVGNLLGAGQADRAKLAARVGIMFGFCFALVWAAVLFGTRNSFADWFTSDDDVRSLVAKIAYLIATYQILDSTGTQCQGVLRGSGHQKAGSIVTLCAYYPIGIPLALLLGFTAHLELTGFWIGMVGGMAFSVTTLVVLVSRLDWDREVQLAAERLALTPAPPAPAAAARGGEDDAFGQPRRPSSVNASGVGSLNGDPSSSPSPAQSSSSSSGLVYGTDRGREAARLLPAQAREFADDV